MWSSDSGITEFTVILSKHVFYLYDQTSQSQFYPNNKQPGSSEMDCQCELALPHRRGGLRASCSCLTQESEFWFCVSLSLQLRWMRRLWVYKNKVTLAVIYILFCCAFFPFVNIMKRCSAFFKLSQIENVWLNIKNLSSYFDKFWWKKKSNHKINKCILCTV